MALKTMGLVVVAMLCAGGAWAANNDLELPVREAVDSGLGQGVLRDDVKFYFAGQPHPAVSKNMGERRSSRKSHAVLRGSEKSCQVAFLSALKTLQARAVKEGANAIINIESYTRNIPLKSATKYRCVAGNVIVHVALKGDLAKIK